jgi:hypothetical protein
VVTLVFAKSRGKKFVNVTLCEALKSIREMRSYVVCSGFPIITLLLSFSHGMH